MKSGHGQVVTTSYQGFKAFGDKLGVQWKIYVQSVCAQRWIICNSKNHIRSSYRNFYYPSDRWQFSGLRLASDIKD